MNKSIFYTLLVLLMVSAQVMALDTRDRAIVMPSAIPGQSETSETGCTKWQKLDCQKHYNTCTETCRMQCVEGVLKGNQKSQDFPIPNCSTKAPIKDMAK